MSKAPQDNLPPFKTPMLYPHIDDDAPDLPSAPLAPYVDKDERNSPDKDEQTEEQKDEQKPTPPESGVKFEVGGKPATVICPSCHAEITTKVNRRITLKNHIFFLFCCLIGCWPIACLPYCLQSCQNADHYCPKCDAYIGTCTPDKQ